MGDIVCGAQHGCHGLIVIFTYFHTNLVRISVFLLLLSSTFSFDSIYHM